jgi:hypothetical protein
MISAVSCHTLIPMNKLDAHERLRRAASLLAHEGANAGDRTLLLQAWEVLRGLRSDDFPVEMRPAFNFLQHEIARAESEDVSARDVAFLTNKLRQLELMWIENSGKSASRGSPESNS